MTDSQDRVVVTGLGATTPVGGDVASPWDAFLTGRSGTRRLDQEWAEQLPVQIGAPAAVDPYEVLPRVQARRLDRSAQFALIAAQQAWSDAGMSEDTVDDERLAVVCASGIGGVTTLLDNYDVLKESGPRKVSPPALPMLMPNNPTVTIGLEIGAKAGVHTPVSACSSGSEAVALALSMIRSGRADVVVAGGTEAAIHPLPMAAFANMQALSRRNDDAEHASRPWDVERDGFVLGEGAGVLVLESEAHARARGARIYAEVAGAGMSADSHHIAQPDPTGAGVVRALNEAMSDAQAAPEDIVHVNAHATSTPLGDVAEGSALRQALGSAADGVTLTSTKSVTGHLLGGAGAVESVATVLTLYHRQAPATANTETVDPELDLDVVLDKPRSLPDGPVAALNNSFGFGGHNIVLTFRSL